MRGCQVGKRTKRRKAPRQSLFGMGYGDKIVQDVFVNSQRVKGECIAVSNNNQPPASQGSDSSEGVPVRMWQGCQGQAERWIRKSDVPFVPLVMLCCGT